MLPTTLLLLALTPPPTALAEPQDVGWNTDLGAATALAERDGRPLLVVFR